MARCLSLSAIVLCTSVGCGGESSNDRFEQLSRQAAEKETQARATAQDSPCQRADQCGVLFFHTYIGSCTPYTHKVYVKQGEPAKTAESLAAEQNALALEAYRHLPPTGAPDTACQAGGPVVPLTKCEADRCVEVTEPKSSSIQ